MPITEGTENTAPVVDANAIANAFSQSLKANGLVITPGAQAAAAGSEVDHFQAAIAEMAANTEGGEGAFAGVKKLFDAYGKKLTAQLKADHEQALGQVTVQTRNAEALNHIYAAVDAYIGDDAALQGFRETLKDGVLRELYQKSENEPSIRNFYQTGVFDHSLAKKLSLAEVNKFNKFRGIDKAVKGPTGLNKSDAAGNGKLPVGSEDGEGISEDPTELKGRELSLYNAKISTAQRAGMRPESKEAKEFALRGVRTFREGKQKAVEKLGSKRFHKD